MPVHLTPIEPPAVDALLTGDPRRAFALAGGLMEQPRMSHQARGLWGYTGTTPGGFDLTVQSTGTGGPSAAAVLSDLAALGVERTIRLGTCVSSVDGPTPGTVLLVEGAICRDGASSGLNGPDGLVRPDPDLTALLKGVSATAVVSSHDFVARLDPAGDQPAPGAAARDLQTALVMSLAERLDVKVAAVLLVASQTGGERLEEKELTQKFIEVGNDVVDRLESFRTDQP